MAAFAIQEAEETESTKELSEKTGNTIVHHSRASDMASEPGGKMGYKY